MQRPISSGRTPRAARFEKLFKRPRSGRSIWSAVYLAAAAALVAALLVPTVSGAFGEGTTFLLGKRNPSPNETRTVNGESELIAKTAVNSYGTRQSNKGSGGGAIYGCRASIGTDTTNPAITTPCVRANNLSTGEAFQFQSMGGSLVGVIQAGPTFTPSATAKPFITNANGVATGLNADKLDGEDSNAIVERAVDATRSSYAQVSSAGTLNADRSKNVKAADVTKGATGVYCFAGIAPAPKNAVANLDGAPGEVSVSFTDSASCPGTEQFSVQTYNSAGVAADAGFFVQVRH